MIGRHSLATGTRSKLVQAVSDRRAIVVLISACGGFLAALLGEPIGLFAPFSALLIFVRRRRRSVLLAALALLLVLAMIALLLAGAPASESRLSWIGLFFTALCIGAILGGTEPARIEPIADPAQNGRLPKDMHPDDAPAVEQARARAFWSGVPQIVSYRARTAEGEWRRAAFIAEPSNAGNIRPDPMVHDPHEPWTMAESFGKTIDAVHAARILESFYGAAFAFDAGGQFTYATPVAQTSISMTLDDLNMPLGGGAFVEGGDFGWKRGVHPDDYPGAASELRRCLRSGDPYNYEYRVLRTTGEYIWHRFAIRPTHDAEGAITGWFGTGFDIDLFRKTEDALRESERSLRELIETAPALIWSMTPEGEPVYFSRQLREFFGFDVMDRDVAGTSRLQSVLRTVIHPDDIEKVNQRFAHSLRTGAPYSLTHRQRRFDGVYRWVETRIAAMRGADGAIVQWNGVCLDIEDQVRAQEELLRTQEKLSRAAQAASLAELSASIAHEVNQPLAAIMTNAQACARWLVADPPNVARAQMIVDRITQSAQSAADIVSHIRSLFSQSSEPRIGIAIDALVAEVCGVIAEQAARCNVQLDVQVPPGLPCVAIDPIQIQQVLVNLLRNGIEAMDGMLADKRLLVTARTDGDEMLRVEVTDSGVGVLDPDRMFEAFFTTKPQGMGMGLAICRSIIESHGGRLWAEAAQPTGARLAFTLPVGSLNA
ncbi:PAS domain-containing sensor histidine kinase [Sphingopyxis fribergensis]|uniref:PAS domain-containing sensor histidine kinase n=1 Tax=Sphingopyxis fribergensis TaxID=1515612 RepID=UPI001E4D40E0|nr:PAS domain-containing protein [Sphingopyxis fribergensis]